MSTKDYLSTCGIGKANLRRVGILPSAFPPMTQTLDRDFSVDHWPVYTPTYTTGKRVVTQVPSDDYKREEVPTTGKE